MQQPAERNTSGADNGSRRQLLLRWVQWMAAAAAALFLYPLVKFTGFKVPAKPRLIEVPAPLPLSGVHTSHDFLLFADPDGQGRAVSRICTHLGCRINYQQDKEYIECPCHQSRFTREGTRISGPAEKNLPVYEVTLKKDGSGKIIAYVVHL